MAEQSKGGASKKKAAAKKRAPAAKKSAAAKTPAPNMSERMDGLQGWMAELEKRQQRTSRVGGLAAILAILASGGALALGIMNKQDAATEADLDGLTEQVNQLSSSVERQTEDQLRAINQRIATLQRQLDNLNARQRESESEITALQTQVGNQAAAADAAAGDGANGSGGEKQP